MPDIFQMAEAIVGSVCSIYSYTIDFICICINYCCKSILVKIKLTITVFCFCF